jgi:hypothetical protein
MNDGLERFEEGLSGVERLASRGKARVDGMFSSSHSQRRMGLTEQTSRAIIRIWLLRIKGWDIWNLASRTL